jgi:hypothetical protein
MTFRTAMAVLATAGVTLAGGTVAQAARKPVAKATTGKKALKRAFGQRAAASEILHWQVHTAEPGLGFEPTDDLWLHVAGSGVVDKVHEVRLDSPYAGEESVITQPFGLGDLRDAITRTRDDATAPIRSANGMGYGDWSVASVISTAIKAADGDLELGGATPVTFEGRAAYAVTIREATDPIGERRNPGEVSVTLFLDRATTKPLAARWGAGADLWRTVYIQSYERLADTPANQRHLTFNP